MLKIHNYEALTISLFNYNKYKNKSTIALIPSYIGIDGLAYPKDNSYYIIIDIKSYINPFANNSILIAKRLEQIEKYESKNKQSKRIKRYINQGHLLRFIKKHYR